MSPALCESLSMVAEAAADAVDDWWIIGSSAVALHGRSVPHVNDVDLLMSSGDAEAFLIRVDEPPVRGQATDRFRSMVFGTWREPPVPVEIMGGFSVAVQGAWREVALSTREAVTVAGRRVYVPSVDELVRLLHLFGRTKDRERAQLLRG